ncbi:MAG: adenylosuccinate lyase [Candidatus Dadabacteria bacterium]|nr:MAG: adenylosuccinate lyase [Candidatus Dadabacteria bacterium]
MIPRYTRPQMAAVWSAEHRYELMLEVEVLVCEALAHRGTIPAEAAKAIRAKARVDPRRVEEIEAEVHHDVIAFVTAAAESVGPEGRYLHYGMTSSDVLDTAFALQLTEAADLLDEGLRALCDAIARRAREHRATSMIGRTHGIHAEPITFGLKLAGWYAELARGRARLAAARREVAVGKLSGAVGTYAANGPDIEAEVLDRLGLACETVATQVVARDRHAVYFSTLAVIAGALERFATEIRHLQRTELLEALEPFGKGQKGSSAMPHKRNPILSENVCGLARVVRSYSMAALENIALWHERDISHSSVERIIAPDATIALDFMIARMTRIIEGLEVRPEAMRRNLELSGGRFASEALLLALVKKGVPREEGYRWIQRCALGSDDFRSAIRADADISRTLDSAEIEEALAAEHALRHVDAIIDRALEEKP